MNRTTRGIAGVLGIALSCTVSATAAGASGQGGGRRAALAPGEIQHVLVIDMENENFSATFGATSPATYLNSVLLKQGQLIENYYGTSHVSLGNYTSQVSGQAPTGDISNDGLDPASLTAPPLRGGFTDITPGTAAANDQ